MKLPTPRTPRQKLIAALLAALAAFVGYLLSDPTGQPPPVPPPEPPRAYGWVPNPVAVAAIQAELACPEFRDTEAFTADYDGPENVYLWDACRKVTGDLLPPRDQRSVGSCVAFGTASAVEHLMCLQIASGSAESYRDLAQEVIYGGSRIEVGGGRVRGDGSVGAWAAKFVQQYGVVPRGVHGPHDLGQYDESRCRAFGTHGVPDDLEPLARRHPVRTITAVTSWAQCAAAIRNGYPVIACSDQGFTMARDADGFCRPRGVWFHCLAVVGVRGGNRPGGFLLNSWGPTAHTGPLGPGNPSPAGFWCDADVLDRMLAAGDSWAFSNVVGFPARKLDWYALRTPDPLARLSLWRMTCLH